MSRGLPRAPGRDPHLSKAARGCVCAGGCLPRDRGAAPRTPAVLAQNGCHSSGPHRARRNTIRVAARLGSCPAHVAGAYRRSGVFYSARTPCPFVRCVVLFCAPSGSHPAPSCVFFFVFSILLCIGVVLPRGLVDVAACLLTHTPVARGIWHLCLFLACVSSRDALERVVRRGRRRSPLDRVTHLLTELEYADYVYVMRRGQILGHGPPAVVGPYLAAAGLVHSP